MQRRSYVKNVKTKYTDHNRDHNSDEEGKELKSNKKVNPSKPRQRLQETPEQDSFNSELESTKSRKKFALFTHQFKARKECKQKEMNLLADPYTKSNIGILGSDVGSGKTITMLSHIKKNKELMPNISKNILAHTPLPSCLANIITGYFNIDTRKLFDVKNLYSKNLLYKYEYAPGPSSVLNNGITEEQKLERKSWQYFDSEQEIIQLPSTLIVASHVLFKRPWCAELSEKFSKSLTYYPIGIKNKFSVEEFHKHDIVLCKANKFNKLAEYCHANRLKWQRVVFDEVDRIEIPSCSPIDSLFYWGITTTYTQLANLKNQGFLRNRFRDLGRDEITRVLVKIEKKNLDPNCYNFPPYLKFVVKCKSNIEHQIINKCYENSPLAKYLNEELYEQALDYMQKLLRKTRSQYNEQMDKFVESVIPKMSLLELQLLNINLNQSISQITKEKRSLGLMSCVFEYKVCIRCKIDISASDDQNAEDGENLKNMDKQVNVSMRTSCCGLNYCFKCAENAKECPVCMASDVMMDFNENSHDVLGVRCLQNKRRKIEKFIKAWEAEQKNKNKKIKVKHSDSEEDVSEGSENDSENDGLDGTLDYEVFEKFENENAPDDFKTSKSVLHVTKKMKKIAELKDLKIDTMISSCVESKCDFIVDGQLDKVEATRAILERHSGQRILIFVNNSKMAQRLNKTLKDLNYKSACLNGASTRIENNATKFEHNELDVLILKSDHTGSGLNMQMTDVIIEFNVVNEIQDIGRAQRCGRDVKNQLKVFQLVHL